MSFATISEGDQATHTWANMIQDSIGGGEIRFRANDTAIIDLYPETDNRGCEIRLIPHGTPIGAFCGELTLLNTDVIEDGTNYELMTISAQKTTGYVFQVQKGGTGSLRAIKFDAQHGATTFQINTDGTLDMMGKLTVTETDEVILDPVNGEIRIDASTPEIRLEGKEGSARDYGFRENAGTLQFMDYTAGSTRWHMDNVGNLYPDTNEGWGVGVAGKRVRLFLKIFTSAPALADMGVGEIAIGDGTGGASEDELFMKPDAGKIVVFQDDGTTRSIT